MSVEPEEWLILGITKDDGLFRPRDWAERLCGVFASYSNGRLAYSKYVHPVMREGHNYQSVVVETDLKNVNPEAYQFIMDFVRDNQLKMMVGRKVVRQSELVDVGVFNFSLEQNILVLKKRWFKFRNQFLVSAQK